MQHSQLFQFIQIYLFNSIIGGYQHLQRSAARLKHLNKIMLQVEHPKPTKWVESLDIFYFIVRQVELDKFRTFVQRINWRKHIELKLSLLKVTEALDSFQRGQLLQRQFELAKRRGIL